MNENISQIVNALVPILCLIITAGGGYLVALIKRQTAQVEKQINNETVAKYIDMAVSAVEQAVASTSQNFVDALKSSGGFTKEKQEEAFQRSRDKVYRILGDTAVDMLNEIYGDFDVWLETRIEQECRKANILKKSTDEKTTATVAASVASTIAATTVQQIAAENATSTTVIR